MREEIRCRQLRAELRGGAARLIVDSVEYTPHMETIQIVIEKELLQAIDRAARRRHVNRSALVRDALRVYLRRMALEDRERRDRDGYVGSPDSEFAVWDRAAAWPDE